VRAIRDVLNPQEHLCPSEEDRRITTADVYKLVRDYR
jgi:hypothetical protein